MMEQFISIFIFIFAYILIVIFYDRKHYIIWGGVLLGILIGLIGPGRILTAINWNVMGVFFGTLIIADLFIRSRMTDYLASIIIRHTRKVKYAILWMCVLSAGISVFAENVATVLILAPIALSISHKLKTSPIPFLVGIAISSNLQGAGTLIGDPPSMLLAAHAKVTFNEFFWLNGKPSIFFAVQVGFIASLIVLYFLFRKYNHEEKLNGKEKINTLVPTYLIIVMVLGLALASNFDPDFTWLSGTICMTIAVIGVLWYIFTHNDKKMQTFFTELDWSTGFFLMGIFVMVGMLEATGVIDGISHVISSITGDNAFLAFMIIVWFSVFFSAFIDNVPYLATMLPVSASLAASTGVSPYLMYFGLLIGASVGGNITPIGAAANIVASGILKKEGYDMKFMDFVKIGLPYTIVGTAAAVAFVWFVWA